MILLDASGLFAFVNGADPHREAIQRLIDEDPGPLILSPYVVAELDYLLSTRIGVQQEAEFLRDVASGAYDLATFDATDIGAATSVIERYRDQNIGLADASIVVLAGRYDTNRVLTLDERHFRTLLTPGGEHFTILPADA